MENWLGRSLKHKLSLLTILAVLVPLFSLGLLSYSIAEGLSEEKAKTEGMKTLDLLQAYLDNMVRDVENMSLFLIGNENVQQDLQARQSDLRKQTSIISFLTDLAFSKAYISNIVIESNDGRAAYSIRSVVSSGLDVLRAEDPEHYDPARKFWSTVYRQDSSLESHQVLTLSRPIRSTKNTTSRSASSASASTNPSSPASCGSRSCRAPARSCCWTPTTGSWPVRRNGSSTARSATTCPACRRSPAKEAR